MASVTFSHCRKSVQVSDANNIGREAINDLRIIIDYFDEIK